MELGQYNITVNALIPGLVDTALTRYEKRLSESIGETGRQGAGEPDAAGGLGRPRADGAAEGRLAAARRHLARRGVPRVRRRRHGDRARNTR